jgi:L-fuconate dehydratase
VTTTPARQTLAPQPTGSRIVGLETHDVRFPTSATLDGSDAMNPSPDYAAAYVILRTNADDGLSGHGYSFTIGTGNEVQLAAIAALAPYIVGMNVEDLCADLGGFWRRLVWESPLRWLGPEKGIMHMAIGAVVNAAWDLASKRAGKPLWRILGELTPSELVALVDFRYLEDVLSPHEALELLEAAVPARSQRTDSMLAEGYPAYTSSPGWLGYSDNKLAALCEEAVRSGFRQVKLKVGADLGDDVRRTRIAREILGQEVAVAVDANQVWDVPTAVGWVRALAPFDLAWVEEPTHPDDILGLAAIRREIHPVPVATGEHVANRVMFKQLLQAEAIDVMQIDACRVAGVNENIVNLLLAAKFGVRVCPHAGGVGLCEAVQHLSMFDFVSVSGSMSDRCVEWIDHLHEHFVDPARVVDGRYQIPLSPGASTEMREESIREYSFPDGQFWQARMRAQE